MISRKMTSVFLFTLDAFRSDLIDHEHTPFLAELQSEGVSFTDAVATGSGTSSAFPGILAGSLPLEYGYAKFRSGHTTVPEHLDKSVHTVGISSSTPTSRRYGFDRGFDEFTDDEADGLIADFKERVRNNSFAQNNDIILQTGEKISSFITGFGSEGGSGSVAVPYAQADEVTETVIDRITDDRAGEDLFVWAHYMDTHTPYHPPAAQISLESDPEMDRAQVNAVLDEYKWNRPPMDGPAEEGVEITERQLSAMKRFYEAEAAFLDQQLQRAVNKISDVCEDYTIVICADHGEEFCEHGHHGHLPKLYEELINVPLIVYSPDGPSDKITHPVSVARIPATLTDVFNQSPADNWLGKSLFDELTRSTNDDYIFSELSHTPSEGLGGKVQPSKAKVAVRDNNWKYIMNEQAGTDELYDLDADPDERENVVDEVSGRGRRLRSACEERLADVTATDSELTVSTNVNERLEDLGYIED